MHRSEALRPLSRDHQHALDAALRLRRADADSAEAARERFITFFREEGERHFAREEALLLPELGAHPGDAERMRKEHAALRAAAARLAEGPAPVGDLREVGEALDDHVRWEERELFALLEGELPADRLAAIGDALAD